MAGRNLRTQRWQKLTRYVIQRDYGICHLCNHAGAESADHLIPMSTVIDEREQERLKYEAANLKAAHFKPCPVCGVKCQNARGHHTVEVGRAKVAERAKKHGYATGYAEPSPQSGREWLASSSSGSRLSSHSAG